MSTPDLDMSLGTGLDSCLDPAIFDDLFQACALEAFVAESRATGGWPNPERTRRCAYDLYETALAEANADRTTMSAKMLVDAA